MFCPDNVLHCCFWYCQLFLSFFVFLSVQPTKYWVVNSLEVFLFLRFSRAADHWSICCLMLACHHVRRVSFANSRGRHAVRVLVQAPCMGLARSIPAIVMSCKVGSWWSANADATWTHMATALLIFVGVVQIAHLLVSCFGEHLEHCFNEMLGFRYQLLPFRHSFTFELIIFRFGHFSSNVSCGTLSCCWWGWFWTYAEVLFLIEVKNRQ